MYTLKHEQQIYNKDLNIKTSFIDFNLEAKQSKETLN